MRLDRKRQDRIGRLLIAVMLTVLIGGIAIRFIWLGSGEDPNRDPTTLCRKDEAPAERVVLLVDKTDPLSGEQVDKLRAAVLGLKNSGLRQDAMLSIYAVGDFPNGWIEQVFCLCNPGFKANEIWQNRKKIRAKYERRFGAPLDSAVRRLAVADSAGQSPLMEALQSLSGTAEFAGGVPRRLILVSDLLQHTAAFSAYTRTHSFKKFRSLPVYQQLKCDLTGATVQIWWTRHMRDQAYSGNDLMGFWTEYLRECGATVEPYRMF